MAGSNRVELIAEELERYLSEHPDAADTFEGIRHWWLTRARGEEANSNVRRALAKLVDDHVVLEKQLPDGRILYRSAQTLTRRTKPHEPD